MLFRSLLTPLRAPAALAGAARDQPMQFLPLGFMPGADRTMLTPTYPTGLPLLLAAAFLITPVLWRAFNAPKTREAT